LLAWPVASFNSGLTFGCLRRPRPVFSLNKTPALDAGDNQKLTQN